MACKTTEEVSDQFEKTVMEVIDSILEKVVCSNIAVVVAMMVKIYTLNIFSTGLFC